MPEQGNQQITTRPARLAFAHGSRWTVRKIVCEAVIQDAGAVALAERITGD
jgi:hypothetical protein